MADHAATSAARPSTIRKDLTSMAVTPNWQDSEQARAAFTWAEARSALAGLPDGGLNIGHEAVDRHAQGERAQKVAIHWLGADGSEQLITYRELMQQSNRFANALTELGLQRGDRLFVLAPRLPQLYVAVLGALKAGLVVSPLFSAFGPEPIATRMNLGAGRALVSTAALYRRKVEPVRAKIDSLEHVLLIDDASGPLPADTHDLDALLRRAPDTFTTVPTRPEDPALLHFTSGTTGKPKGAIHVHEAAVTHYATGRYALDLHDDDIFWCTADPGWVTGTSYGIIAPLLHGVTLIVDEAEFDAERWYGILQAQQVSVWYTAPTAIRMLMKAGADVAAKFEFPATALHRQRRRAAQPRGGVVGPGGVRPADPRQLVADRDRRHHDRQHCRAGHQARLDGQAAAGRRGRDRRAPRRWRRRGRSTSRTSKANWRCGAAGRRCSAATCNEDARYRKCFVDDWYLTGDLAKRDADGYFWFVGRADDVIKSAGHLIGPFEVESALMEHPAVAEAGVIGKPDPLVGEIVKAFVALKPGFDRERRAAARVARPRAQAPGPVGGAEGDRLRCHAAAHAQRQDHAPAAQGARTGPARRRHVDAGGIDVTPVPCAVGHRRQELHARVLPRARARHAAHPSPRRALRAVVRRGQDPRLPAPVRSVRRR